MPFAIIVLLVLFIFNPLLGLGAITIVFLVQYFWVDTPTATTIKEPPPQVYPDWFNDTGGTTVDFPSIITGDSIYIPEEIPELDNIEPVTPTVTLFEEPANIQFGNMYMSAEAKSAHLQSSYWKNLKIQRMFMANNNCEQCGVSDKLDLHHTTYTNLGLEPLSDVRVLCRNCHQTIHDTLGYDRTTEYPIKE